ncbi:AraC-like DNA-binding protein [Chitinophaga dinghuensis]|uniref:AraC-like DNA-binding protein n=1 Tax=Chitinophaga dinghuensis TaxID=1539050 RepID=A0A327VQ66_9BACT|nr:AraC family transcriptional regulator [Chitinophaga dinghuensis]RAJ75698.1 AraC-like DNA-binding protein [Chitinophaga dinghuensis]
MNILTPTTRNYGHMQYSTAQENILTNVKTLIEEIYESDISIDENFQPEKYIQSRLSTPQEEVELWFIDKYEKTIRQYTMEVRVNKVKELLVYTDLSTSEIAHKLGYASIELMSEELIQLTGLPIVFFQHIKEQKAQTAMDQRKKK